MADENNKEITIHIEDEDNNSLERLNYEYTSYIDSIAYLLDRHLLDKEPTIFEMDTFKEYQRRSVERLADLEDEKRKLFNKYIGPGVVIVAYSFNFKEKELTYIS